MFIIGVIFWSLWNLEAYLVLWLEMHFRNKISMCGKKIMIEGGIFRRSHSIPLRGLDMQMILSLNEATHDCPLCQHSCILKNLSNTFGFWHTCKYMHKKTPLFTCRSRAMHFTRASLFFWIRWTVRHALISTWLP